MILTWTNKLLCLGWIYAQSSATRWLSHNSHTKHTLSYPNKLAVLYLFSKHTLAIEGGKFQIEHTTCGKQIACTQTGKSSSWWMHALPFIIPLMATWFVSFFWFLCAQIFLPFALCCIKLFCRLWLEVCSNVTPTDLVFRFLCFNSTLYTVKINESSYSNVWVPLGKDLHTFNLSKPIRNTTIQEHRKTDNVRSVTRIWRA